MYRNCEFIFILFTCAWITATCQDQTDNCATGVGDGDLKEKVCPATGNGIVQPSCLSGAKIVIDKVIAATKLEDQCNIKVVAQGDANFCCRYQGLDKLFDVTCVANWSGKEVQQLYLSLENIVKSCNEKVNCTFNQTLLLFPRWSISKNKFSSYVLMTYNCLKDTQIENKIDLCEEKVLTGKEIYLKTKSRGNHNIDGFCSCTCNITSETGNIQVKALDVRLKNSTGQCTETQLNISDSQNAEVIRCERDRFLFGFEFIFIGQKTELTLDVQDLNSGNLPSNIWLEISVSDGSNVTVSCGEIIQDVAGAVKPSPPLEGQNEGFPYWSALFVVVGVICTCSVIAAALVIYLVCRRKDKSKHCQPVPDPPYATVQDARNGLHRPIRVSCRSNKSIYSRQTLPGYSSQTSQFEEYDRCYSHNSLPDRPPPPLPASIYNKLKRRNENGDINAAVDDDFQVELIVACGKEETDPLVEPLIHLKDEDKLSTCSDSPTPSRPDDVCSDDGGAYTAVKSESFITTKL